MPRKGHVAKRKVDPDPLYKSEAIAKFIHCLMYDGKKSVAERIVYEALEQAGKGLMLPPMKYSEKALENVKPLVEVRPRRVGGATYQVPVEVAPYRAQALAIRWIIKSARSRKGIPMIECLAREFIDAYKGEGTAIKKREDTHRMAGSEQGICPL